MIGIDIKDLYHYDVCDHEQYVRIDEMRRSCSGAIVIGIDIKELYYYDICNHEQYVGMNAPRLQRRSCDERHAGRRAEVAEVLSGERRGRRGANLLSVACGCNWRDECQDRRGAGVAS